MVLTGSGATTKRYAYDVFGNRATIAEGSNRYSYLYDPHTSVSLLIDQNNSVKESYGYAAYGAANAALTKTASGFNNKTNPYRYTGKRLDSGSGTYDMGARRYSASTGRFLQYDLYYNALDNLGLSEDPLTQNRYALAGANPVNFVEVDGHRPQNVINEGGSGSYASTLGWGDCQVLRGAYRQSCVANHPDLGAQEVNDLELVLAAASGIGAVAALVREGVRRAAGFLAGVLGRGGPTVGANKTAGDAFADAIASAIPGARQGVGFRTRFGMRFVDVLTTSGVAIEAKVGRTRLTKSVRRQLAKDVQLLRSGDVVTVVWAFKKSEVTGKAGPSRQLKERIQALQARGLKITWVLVP